MTEKKQFFYAFSQGEYSDYHVQGLYVCDHEVDKEEWYALYSKFQTEQQEKWADVHQQGEKYGRRSTEYLQTFNSFLNWEEENNPEVTFQKLHNMQPIEYKELWRDC